MTVTRTVHKYYDKRWWAGCLLLAAPGCICSHGPLIAFPEPIVVGCPQSQPLPPTVVSMPLPAPTPQQGQSIRSEVAQPDGVLPPELPGSIRVPNLTPGERLPSAEPGPAIETPPAPARPALSVPNRPGRRRVLALEVAR